VRIVEIFVFFLFFSLILFSQGENWCQKLGFVSHQQSLVVLLKIYFWLFKNCAFTHSGVSASQNARLNMKINFQKGNVKLQSAVAKALNKCDD